MRCLRCGSDLIVRQPESFVTGLWLSVKSMIGLAGALVVSGLASYLLFVVVDFLFSGSNIIDSANLVDIMIIGIIVLLIWNEWLKPTRPGPIIYFVKRLIYGVPTVNMCKNCGTQWVGW